MATTNLIWSYPDKPDLAWTEGFSDAFAAAVSDNHGILLWSCAPHENLSQSPVRPSLATEVDQRYAQYNEARVGAAAYQLLDYLGENAVGLARLLDALTQYKRDGHSVWTARDLRDMAVQEIEKTAADHAAIDAIFAGQEIAWGQEFAFGVPIEDDGMRAAFGELALSVIGPGGFDCHVNSDQNHPKLTTLDDGHQVVSGIKSADGGLTFSANDDCYMISGDGKLNQGDEPHTFGIDDVEIPFPYLAGLVHWQGLYFVRAKFVCAFDPKDGAPHHCPNTLKVRVSAVNVHLVLHARELAAPQTVILHRNVDQVVATFSADGKCILMASSGAIDCGF